MKISNEKNLEELFLKQEITLLVNSIEALDPDEYPNGEDYLLNWEQFARQIKLLYVELKQKNEHRAAQIYPLIQDYI